jgi:hypothetical protein
LLILIDLDLDRLAIIRDCSEHYDVGDPEAEWPNNIISRRAVVYGSGVIARADDKVQHAVDPDELVLCCRLATEAAGVMAETDVGMGSDSSNPFHGFFVAGSVNEPAPSDIDEPLIRSRFGGTLFPPVTITIEHLAEAGVWWSEVEADGAESGGSSLCRGGQ